MKLWKVDLKQCTVREVEGEAWPGTDAEGDTCYTNSHFTTAAAAWKQLEAEASAGVSLAGVDVRQAEQQLQVALRRAGEAAKTFEIAMQNVRRARAAEESTHA